MNSRNVAVVIFTDGKDVVVQERGSYSKIGEKYGFWGGRIEKREGKDLAIKRELKEELGFVPKDLSYWGNYSYVVEEEGIYKGIKVNSSIFISPITKRLLNANTLEGKGVYKMSMNRAIKGSGFPLNSTSFLKELKNSLQNKK